MKQIVLTVQVSKNMFGKRYPLWWRNVVNLDIFTSNCRDAATTLTTQSGITENPSSALTFFYAHE